MACVQRAIVFVRFKVHYTRQLQEQTYNASVTNVYTDQTSGG